MKYPFKIYIYGLFLALCLAVDASDITAKEKMLAAKEEDSSQEQQFVPIPTPKDFKYKEQSPLEYEEKKIGDDWRYTESESAAEQVQYNMQRPSTYEEKNEDWEYHPPNKDQEDLMFKNK